jgi:hypothetical protein
MFSLFRHSVPSSLLPTSKLSSITPATTDHRERRMLKWKVGYFIELAGYEQIPIINEDERSRLQSLWICEFISISQTKIPPNSAHESRNPRHITHLKQCALLLRDSGKVSSHVGDLYSQTLPNRTLWVSPCSLTPPVSGPVT